MFQFYYEIPISSGFISSSRLPFALTLKFIFFIKEKNDQHIVKDSQLEAFLQAARLNRKTIVRLAYPGITSTITSLIFVIHLWKRDNNRRDLGFRILNLYHVHDQVFP